MSNQQNVAVIDSDDQQATMLAMIQNAAMSDSIDADKLDKLLSVQERWEANQAKKSFDRAMAEFRQSVGPITKDKDAHNSRYASLAHTISQIKADMGKNGLSHSWRTEQGDGMIRVTCIVSHIDGHSEKTTLESPSETSGSKNAIQAIGSAVSYLQRYTLFAILGLASTDQDDDGQTTSQRLIDDGQLADLIALMDEVLDANSRKKFKDWLSESGVPGGDVASLPAARFQEVVNQLERKRKS